LSCRRLSPSRCDILPNPYHWKVPKIRNKPHGVKISIVYIKNGKRLVGYDNAEGKGYHRHIRNSEEEYTFTDIWQLIEDFKNDVSRIRGREWDEGQENPYRNKKT